MIPRYIPGETRRMRLDRILAVEGGAFAPEAPCKIWGEEAVDPYWDLHLSDHYGLLVDLSVNIDGFRGDPVVRALLERNSKEELEESTFSKCRFAFALIVHSFWLMRRAANLLLHTG